MEYELIKAPNLWTLVSFVFPALGPNGHWCGRVQDSFRNFCYVIVQNNKQHIAKSAALTGVQSPVTAGSSCWLHPWTGRSGSRKAFQVWIHPMKLCWRVCWSALNIPWYAPSNFPIFSHQNLVSLSIVAVSCSW